MAEMSMRVDVALSEVPVNIFPLLDDGDFKTRETSVAYNAAGMDLVWNFVTANGAYTQTAVTPTTGGNYDWASQGDAMYSIEIPASGGASINNDTEGFGWFTGIATGVLPWRGPIIQFIPDAIADVEDGSTALGTAQTGDAYAIVNSGSYGNSAIKTQTASIETDTQDIQTRIPAALVSGRIDASVGAMAANTVTASAVASDAVTEIQNGLSTLNAAGVRTAVGLSSANLDTQLDALPTAAENAAAVITTAMTESYAADGATMTVAQALYEVRALLSEFSISGVTLTAHKKDGSTTAATYTLNSSTAPTSITRSG